MTRNSARRADRREKRQVARDITYATSVASKAAQTMVRVMENATGRIGLIKRAEGYQDEIRLGGNFWEIMVERYGLSLDVVGGSLDNIPETGPVLVVANHPYGILDGLMLGHIMSKRRGDFRILAHRVFRKAEDLDNVILPISFDESKEAVALNISTRKVALKYLADGGIIGIFPGGTVSTAHKPFARPMDPSWRSFTARMISKSQAQVVPIFFDGHNSRLWQLMSHLHTTLRMGLLIKEFRARVNTPVRVVVGEPIPRPQIDAHRSDPRAMMEFLREQTYALSPHPVDASQIGFEFEERYGATRPRDWY